MNKNDLIKIIGDGYAEGDGSVAANWDSEKQTIADPAHDMLAHYLATWVDSQTLGKSDVGIYSELLTELSMAIEDLTKLSESITNRLVMEMCIRFFTHLQRRAGRSVTKDIVDSWLFSQEDYAPAIYDENIINAIMELLASDAAPQAERCELILSLLLTNKAALFGKEKAPASGAPDVVPEPVPEMKK